MPYLRQRRDKNGTMNFVLNYPRVQLLMKMNQETFLSTDCSEPRTSVHWFLNACFVHNTASFEHKISDFDVRRNILEFGRCFLTGSIAGGVLRNENSAHESQNFSNCAKTLLN